MSRGADIPQLGLSLFEMRLVGRVVVAVVLLGLVGCGDDDDGSGLVDFVDGVVLSASDDKKGQAEETDSQTPQEPAQPAPAEKPPIRFK